MPKTSRVFLTVSGMVAAMVGFSLGAGARESPVEVAAACAQYECELHMFCEPNEGGNTYCEREDNSNKCQTRACSVE